jgi:hypothetical protein
LPEPERVYNPDQHLVNEQRVHLPIAGNEVFGYAIRHGSANLELQCVRRAGFEQFAELFPLRREAGRHRLPCVFWNDVYRVEALPQLRLGGGELGQRAY